MNYSKVLIENHIFIYLFFFLLEQFLHYLIKQKNK